MTTESTIAAAITRSISHTEIVKVNVTWPRDGRSAEETILDWIDGIEGVEDPDTAQENDGTYDVWGTLKGSDFRIRIATAE